MLTINVPTLKFFILCIYFLQFTQYTVTGQLIKNPEYQQYDLLDRIDSNSEIFKRFMTKKYCGRVLADTLERICKNTYNKRGESGEVQYDQQPMNIESMRPLFLPRNIALNLKSNMRKRRGIVEECCHKPCNYAELKAYCGSLKDS